MPKPRMLPFPVRAFETESEKQIYHLLESQLSPEYTVLYGRRWVRHTSHGNPDPECDFIIAKPGAGIIDLEVKGGVWTRRAGQWHANGLPVVPKDDPFRQAQENKAALVELLKGFADWKDVWFPVDFAVALPDTRFEAQSDMLGLPCVLTHHELNYIAEWTSEAMAQCLNRNWNRPCTPQMVQHLIHATMRDYIVRLRDVLAVDEEGLVILTEDQLRLDKSLARRKQLTIQGCAGSGKTWMAIKQVKRLAATPGVNKILFTCFNAELGKWLKSMTSDVSPKCDTITFLTFCEQQAQACGLLTGKEEKDREYFAKLPDLLMESLSKTGLCYDAVVVDEGQIFENDWWASLQLLLRDTDRSYFYVFYDDLQRIYSEVHHWIPYEEGAIDLTVNIRNTANIHRQATKFLPKDKLPECGSVEGQPVFFGTYEGEASMKQLLQHALQKLIRDGGVSSKDIIILTTKGQERTVLQEGKFGPYQLTRSESDDPAAVRFSTIQAFRGMERKVVILTELEGKPEQLEPLVYLGASRAKTLLVLLVYDHLHGPFKQQLVEGCVPLQQLGAGGLIA